MTHRDAIATVRQPGLGTCRGELAYLTSNYCGAPPRHRDVYVCADCGSRVALNDDVLLFVDGGNALERECQPEGSAEI